MLQQYMFAEQDQNIQNIPVNTTNNNDQNPIIAYFLNKDRKLNYPYEIKPKQSDDPIYKRMVYLLNTYCIEAYFYHYSEESHDWPQVVCDVICRTGEIYNINCDVAKALYLNVYLKFSKMPFISIDTILISYKNIMMEVPMMCYGYNNDKCSVVINDKRFPPGEHIGYVIYDEFVKLYRNSMYHICNETIKYFTNLVQLSKKDNTVWKTYYNIWDSRSKFCTYHSMKFFNTLIAKDPEAYITLCKIWYEWDVLSPCDMFHYSHPLNDFAIEIVRFYKLYDKNPDTDTTIDMIYNLADITCRVICEDYDQNPFSGETINRINETDYMHIDMARNDLKSYYEDQRSHIH